MYPVLFSLFGLPIASLSIFLILAWCVFSFLFWKSLRRVAVEETKIFDLTFYATVIAFLFARIVFVVLHFELFSDNWLKIVALWVTPGLSFLGALFGGTITLLLLAKKMKVRMGIILDALATGIAGTGIVGAIGVFLDGSEIGTPTSLPWAIGLPGVAELRHPIAIYELLCFSLLSLIVVYVTKVAQKRHWRSGSIGMIFFLFFSIALFIIEFFKVHHIYWTYLSPNQWLLIAVFVETIGAFYVRGGGRERIAPVVWHFVHSLHQRGRLAYDTFFKRRTY